ncbi:MAG: LiaI-LiaF-like domain-containing protein [Acidobacteriaceae bacterium]
MNCTNHPDVPVSAYCQFCGKPLCKDCVRSIGGVVYCEPCLAARVQAPGAYPGAAYPGASYPGTAQAASQSGTAQPGTASSGVSSIPLPSAGPNPILAGLLGLIPGVGAMYNAQFAKGIAHVIIFAVLTSLANITSAFGILVFGWVCYQVFDAYQTARARQLGLPLPDPFGLNDIGHKFGLQPLPGFVPPTQPPSAGGGFYTGAPYTPPAPNPAADPNPPAAGFAPFSQAPFSGAPYTQPPYTEAPPPGSPYPGAPYPGSPYPGSPYPGAPPYGASDPYYPGPAAMHGRAHGDLPVGAIVLIGLGLLFLFHSLGILHGDWVGRGWPVLIIGLGVWLFIRRSRDVQRISGPANSGPANSGPANSPANGPTTGGPQ